MSGRRVFSLCALLIAAPLVAAQQPSTPISGVEDIVRIGLQNNRDLAAVRERINEAEGLARQAGVRPSPTLGLSGATGSPLGTAGQEEYSAEYSQSIELFGKRGKRVQVADLAVATAEADLQQRSAELAYQIKAAYAEVLAEHRKLKLLGELNAVNQSVLQLTEARAKEGDVAPLDASLLKVEIAQASVRQISARGRLTSAELDLRRLAGLDPSAKIPETDFQSPASVPLDALKQKALESRADLRSARLAEKQEAAGIALAQANALPDLTFSGGYSRRYSQFDGLFGLTTTGALSPIKDRENLLTFGVSIPLRTSRSGVGNVQAAVARSSEARFRREYLERTIPLEVEAAYQRWRSASEALQMLQSGVVDPAVTNLSIIRQAYTLGQLRLIDVLNEQRRLVDMQMAYIDAETDSARSWAEVERTVGGNLP